MEGKSSLIEFLKTVFANEKWIYPNQASFVPGRKNHDNIIFLQEVIHTMRKKERKEGGYMAVKME